MSQLTVSTDIANRTKPTLASSPVVGLTVRATGEEKTKLLDNHGNQFDCEIPQPTSAPSSADNGSGNLTANKWVAYRYVYASTVRYPFVENDLSYAGSLAPRGNPSPSDSHHLTGGGNRQVTITMARSDRADINAIWLFRTAYFNSQTEAETAADSGQAFYIASITNVPGVGNTTYNDNSATVGTDVIELDNFAAPTFQFVWFADPYWYGIGNFPFEAEVTWETDGTVELTLPSDKWYNGRDGQVVHLEGITTGGFDGLGSYKFQWTSATTAQLTTDGTTPANVSSAGSGTITIQGPATTLYRSKRRNPFSWGETLRSAGTNTPVQWLHKVGGGRATAIFSVPNIPYLVISTEYPASMYALDLRLAGTDSFRGSQLTISEQYSVSVHWSQFVATRMEDRAFVMWGLDVKNYCILECDGNSVRVVSDKVAKTLRAMSQDPSRQLMSHGIYDPYYQINCMWFPTQNALAPVNWMVFQHVPTGGWFFHDENDLLCTALYQDPAQNVFKVFAGTQTGLLGQINVEGKYDNWLSEEGLKRGEIASATGTSIIRQGIELFDTSNNGTVGNWCLITDENDSQEQWARVSGVDASSLSFDLVYPYLDGSTDSFNPVPVAGWKFYLGLIEISALKYFDYSSPADDKKLDEIFATLQNVDTLADGTNPSTFLRFYRERQTAPEILPDNITDATDANRLFMERIPFESDGSNSDGWITENPFGDQMKSFGIEIVDRGYEAWKMFNWVIKAKQQ